MQRTGGQHAFDRYAFGALIALCSLGYLAIELVYFKRLPLVMDELDGAYDVYRLRDQIPYRDFKPYKTVLGYYLELPPLLLARDVWSGLMNVKIWLAVINAACMALAAWLASETFSRASVAFALPCWVLMTTWLERSSELRVDTLTAWAGLFSLLFLLRGRAVLAGFLAGLSFLISQKGAYYIAASGPALLLPLALPERRREALRDLVRFGTACALTIGPYLLFFSVLASPEKTAHTTFTSHNAIVFKQIYPNIRKFWRQTLALNPGFYALTVLGLCALFVRSIQHFVRREQDETALRNLRMLAYGVTLAAGGIWHKQPWPYFFVLLIPTAFLACVAAFELLAPWRLPWRAAPAAQRVLGSLSSVVLAGSLVLAIAFPIGRMPVILRESNAYQRHMIALASALVREGEHYFAGMDVLYDREQPSKRLQRFSIMRRAELEKAKPDALAKVMQELKQAPPKLLIRTERFKGLTPGIRKHLKDNYAPFWGNIELYAPRSAAGTRSIELAFAGAYRVAIEGKGEIALIDAREARDDEIIELQAGAHSIAAPRFVRLVLQPPPEVKRLLDPRFKKRQDLFPRAYDR